MSPFAWVVFHRSATPCDPAYAKSGQNARRPRSIVIVGAPVGIHITEIIAIVVIGGAEPPPHGGRSPPRRPTADVQTRTQGRLRIARFSYGF